MGPCSCGGGLVAAAALALLAVPAPRWLAGPPAPEPAAAALPAPPSAPWELAAVGVLLTLAAAACLTHRLRSTILRRRVDKLALHVRGCVERARGWEARRARLEDSLRVARAAALEYRLLLHLLRRAGPPHQARAPGGRQSCLGDHIWKQPDTTDFLSHTLEA